MYLNLYYVNNKNPTQKISLPTQKGNNTNKQRTKYFNFDNWHIIVAVTAQHNLITCYAIYDCCILKNIVFAVSTTALHKATRMSSLKSLKN